MKTFFILALFILAPIVASAKVYSVDFYVEDSEGCKFHVTGTVDANIIPPGLNSYELNIEDCNGDSWNFSGIANPGNTGSDLSNYHYTVTNIKGENPTLVDLQMVLNGALNYVERNNSNR